MNNSPFLAPTGAAELLAAFEERMAHLTPEERNEEVENMLFVWFEAGVRWAESRILPQ